MSFIAKKKKKERKGIIETVDSSNSTQIYLLSEHEMTFMLSEMFYFISPRPHKI